MLLEEHLDLPAHLEIRHAGCVEKTRLRISGELAGGAIRFIDFLPPITVHSWGDFCFVSLAYVTREPGLLENNRQKVRQIAFLMHTTI